MYSLHATDRIQTQGLGRRQVPELARSETGQSWGSFFDKRRARTSVLLSLALMLFLISAFDARAAVVFKSFGAVQDGSTILVKWETATELDSVAFNLYRSQSPSGPWTELVNQQPAHGDGATGSKYSYTDTAVAAGIRYYYYLKELTASGFGSEVGPIDARVDLPAHRVYLPIIVR
jgi:hypothetical protein